MKKRGIFILLMCLFMWLSLAGQEVSHQVLVPLASVVEIGNYNISQTIGEPFVDYLRTDSYDLTQGFQQPLPSRTIPGQPLGNGINAYPNPVISDLKIEMFGKTSIEYEVVIFAINGIVYFRKNYTCLGPYWQTESINMQNFRRGIYFVRVRSVDDQIVRLFKIEKIK